MSGQNVGVIQQFLHPPIGLCSLEEANADHVDRVVYTRTRGPIDVDAFGIRVSIFSWPEGYGVDESTTALVFDRDVIRVNVLHGMLDGSSVFTDQLDTRRGSVTVMFTESFPKSVEVWTSPGIHAVVDWVLLLGS